MKSLKRQQGNILVAAAFVATIWIVTVGSFDTKAGSAFVSTRTSRLFDPQTTFSCQNDNYCIRATPRFDKGALLAPSSNTALSSSSSSSSSSPSSSSRDIVTLQDWASENGVQFHNHVGLVSSASDNDESNDNWGVSVLESTDSSQPSHFEAGTVVLSVPTRLVLSSSKVAKELEEEYNLDLQEPMTLLDKEGFANQQCEFLLVVKILLELNKGSDSLWQPWLQSLPQTFPTGVYMNSFEKSVLSPFAFALAEFETKKLAAFRQALTCLVEQPAAEESLSSLKSLLSKQDSEEDDVVKWAYNVVFSRCWRYADQLQNESAEADDYIGRSDIVPLGDMFNHADPANVVVNYRDNARENDCNENESEDALTFVLTQGITTVKNQHPPALCLSYGLVTNPCRFLILFGFVSDQMKELYCQVLFTNPSKEMVELGCNDRSKMVYRVEDGAIADTVWDTVLYSLLEQQTGNLKAEAARTALYQAHIDNDIATKKEIRKKYSLETCLTLRNHVVRTLKEFDQLVDQVNTVIQASGDVALVEKEHPHLGMIHRHNRFMQDVFQKVQDRLDDIAKTETTRRRKEMAKTQ